MAQSVLWKTMHGAPWGGGGGEGGGVVQTP